MPDDDEVTTEAEAPTEWQHPATIEHPRGTFPRYQVEEGTVVQFIGIDGQTHEVTGYKQRGGRHVIEPRTAEEAEVVGRFGWKQVAKGEGIEAPEPPAETEGASQ